tara:strand:+ start:413 stop:730 length:318 start_codon:yes stop_codon:yes gene_type:complete
MKKGTIVERTYSISNMKKYQDTEFLLELDRITKEDGITILERTIKKNSVRLKARFDSDQWDMCRALEYLTQNGVSVKPISDFTIVVDKCVEQQNQIKKVLEILEA